MQARKQWNHILKNINMGESIMQTFKQIENIKDLGDVNYIINNVGLINLKN